MWAVGTNLILRHCCYFFVIVVLTFSCNWPSLSHHPLWEHGGGSGASSASDVDAVPIAVCRSLFPVFAGGDTILIVLCCVFSLTIPPYGLLLCASTIVVSTGRWVDRVTEREECQVGRHGYCFFQRDSWCCNRPPLNRRQRWEHDGRGSFSGTKTYDWCWCSADRSSQSRSLSMIDASAFVPMPSHWLYLFVACFPFRCRHMVYCCVFSFFDCYFDGALDWSCHQMRVPGWSCHRVVLCLHKNHEQVQRIHPSSHLYNHVRYPA